MEVPLQSVSWLLQLDVIQLLTPVRLHLKVGSNAVVLRHGATVVDDATLVRALVWRFDAGEAELVGDVAASHFYHLERKTILFSLTKS